MASASVDAIASPPMSPATASASQANLIDLPVIRSSRVAAGADTTIITGARETDPRQPIPKPSFKGELEQPITILSAPSGGATRSKALEVAATDASPVVTVPEVERCSAR